jgi:hypothetical protein
MRKRSKPANIRLRITDILDLDLDVIKSMEPELLGRPKIRISPIIAEMDRNIKGKLMNIDIEDEKR